MSQSQSTQAVELVSPTANEPPPQMDWGMGGLGAIAGGLLSIVIQRLFTSYDRKEQQESDLVKSLVTGLQNSQEKLLNQQYEVIQELKEAVNDLGSTVKRSFEAYDRNITHLEQRIRDLENRQ